MNRKDFLAKSGAAAVLFGLSPALLSCSSSRIMFDPLTPAAGNLARVRGNVFRFVHQGGNVGLFETKEGFIVVDSQFPQLITPLIESISQRNKPVLYLANTHHHGDHTSGNISFKDLTKNVVAHNRVPELQRKAAAEKNTLDQQLYANILFDNSYKLNLGREKVTAYHFGAGHTYGDAVYHFEKDNVIHMGDLMFRNMIPVYRTADGSDAFGWINVLQQVLEKFDSDTLYIFGHADKPENATGTKIQLQEMKNFLEASVEFVRKNTEVGMSVEEMLQKHEYIPGFESRKTPQRFPDFLKSIKETLYKTTK